MLYIAGVNPKSFTVTISVVIISWQVSHYRFVFSQDPSLSSTVMKGHCLAWTLGDGQGKKMEGKVLKDDLFMVLHWYILRP